MKTWNPVKLVSNLFRYFRAPGAEEQNAFISAGFRLGVWGAVFGVATALVCQAALVWFAGRQYDLAEAAARSARGLLMAALTMRGIEGLAEDTGIVRRLLNFRV